MPTPILDAIGSKVPVLAAVGKILLGRLTAKTGMIEGPSSTKEKVIAVLPEVVEQVKEVLHEDPNHAVVRVEGTWLTTPAFVAGGSILSGVAFLILGHDIDPELKSHLMEAVMGLVGLYVWWKHYRGTSISSAASANVLGKPPLSDPSAGPTLPPS